SIPVALIPWAANSAAAAARMRSRPPRPGRRDTRDIDAAVIAARHRLPGARTFDDSVLTA
ncbi:hypothetical protein AB0C89_37300, partial [Streptomyces sp. NPDC048491]